jgi:hypothetical protein
MTLVAYGYGLTPGLGAGTLVADETILQLMSDPDIVIAEVPLDIQVDPSGIDVELESDLEIEVAGD